ncbi:MAG: UDP-glucose 4-epimerase, partial [Clostridia bacterium]|nr:UDP-glucose 4-epimerase [Clostridia bacterium]
RGHVLVLNKHAEAPGEVTYNLGTGRGYSGLEMIAAVSKACGKELPYKITERRPGDIAECYADCSLAKAELGFEAEYGIDEMCADLWRWQTQNPNGYGE